MEPVRVIEGAVSVIDRNDVDTDQIIPKQFLKRVERTGFGEFLFHDWSKEPGWDLPSNPILAAGRNFGCGSSREHAPWALEDYGFRAVVAPSFADIFYSNCTKIGLLPVTLPEGDVKALMDAGHARIDLEEQEVSFAGRQVGFDIDPEIARRLLEGLDDIGVTLQQQHAIDDYEAARERSGPVTTALDMNRDWDAATYDRVSRPLEELATTVLDRLDLSGDETVLDAGCGSGNVTLMLLERLPRGHVIAVDQAASMVEHAREALNGRARVFQSDLTELELDSEVDAVFSSAVFHWVADHDRLFARLFAALRPAAGSGPSAGERATSNASTRRRAPWGPRRPTPSFWPAGPDPGTSPAPSRPPRVWSAPASRAVETWLEPTPDVARGPEDYLRTICLGYHLEQLPEELRDDYVRAVLARSGDELDYVRLNINARRPA